VNVGTFPPHWAGTTITWDLTDASAGTRAAFSHSGFPVGENEITMISEIWGLLMTRLKDYAETGNSSPFFTV
jgi:uncharacterized protein YndB with AHSA1/START domain